MILDLIAIKAKGIDKCLNDFKVYILLFVSIVFIISFCMSIFSFVYAQFPLNDFSIRNDLVSENPDNSFNNFVNLSSNGNTSIDVDISSYSNNIYVIWKQYDNRTEDILFKRSTNGGATFDKTVILTKGFEHTSIINPHVMVTGNNVYVTWDHHDRKNLLRFLTSSKDGGATFSRPILLTNNTGNLQDYRSFAASGNKIYFLSTNNDTGNTFEYIIKSTDGGATFSRPILLTNNTGSLSEIPDVTDIFANGDNVYVVWSDNSTGTPRQYFSRSIDNGSTFDMISDLGINSIPGVLNPVRISSSANNVYVTWSDDTRFPYIGIYLVQSTDRGVSFMAPIKLSNNIDQLTLPGLPRIATDGNNVYVVWRGIDNTDRLFFTQSTDGGATFSKATDLLNLAADSLDHPSVASTGNSIYIAWAANITDNYKIFFTKMLNNNTGLSRNYYPYINEKNGSGIYLEYPTDWKRLSNDNIPIYDIAAFQIPSYIDPTNQSIFEISVDNSSLTHKESLSPEKYLQKRINLLRFNENADQTQFIIISNRSDILSIQGYPGYEISYIQMMKNPSFILRGSEVGYIINNTAYIMILRVPAGSDDYIYREELPQLTHVVGSFTFIKNIDSKLQTTINAFISIKNSAPVQPSFHTDLLNSLADNNSTQDSLLQDNKEAIDKGFILYENPLYGIKFEFPSKWIKKENYYDNSLMFNPIDNKVSVIIFVFKLPENGTLTNIANMDIMRLRADNPNLNVNISKTTLGGMPAYKIMANGTMDYEGIIKKFSPESEPFSKGPVYSTKSLEFITVKDDIGYGIVYNFDPITLNGLQEYSYYMPVVQKMIDSFKIANKTQYP
jgi:hypothetical protein